MQIERGHVALTCSTVVIGNFLSENIIALRLIHVGLHNGLNSNRPSLSLLNMKIWDFLERKFILGAWTVNVRGVFRVIGVKNCLLLSLNRQLSFGLRDFIDLL